MPTMSLTQKIGAGASIVGGSGTAIPSICLLSAAKISVACGATLASIGGAFLLVGVLYLACKVDLQCIPGLPFSKAQRMIMETPGILVELDGQIRRVVNTVWPGCVYGDNSSSPEEVQTFLKKLDNQTLTFEEIKEFFLWMQSQPMEAATGESMLAQMQLIQESINEVCGKKSLPAVDVCSATPTTPLLASGGSIN